MAEQEKNITLRFPLTKVSFCIDGDDLSPESMTEQLGISPTAAWRKGEVRRDRDGNRYYEKHPAVSPVQYAYSHWRYSTEYEQVHDIMQPISLILERFVPLLDILIRARVWTQFTYHISIAMKRVNTEEPFVFPEMTLSAVSDPQSGLFRPHRVSVSRTGVSRYDSSERRAICGSFGSMDHADIHKIEVLS